MKYAKTLGLAVVTASALMAFAGAGTASASVLCSTNAKTVCGAGWEYAAGTEVHATMTESATVIGETEGGVLVTCSEGTIKFITSNRGSMSETVEAKVTSWTWGNCSSTTDTTGLGEFEIHHIEGSATNGTITSKNTNITFNLFGSVSCTYTTGAGIDFGTLTRSTEPNPGEIKPPIIDVNTTVTKSAGGFLCPAFLGMSAKYTVTSPKTLSTKTS